MLKLACSHCKNSNLHSFVCVLVSADHTQTLSAIICSSALRRIYEAHTSAGRSSLLLRNVTAFFFLFGINEVNITRFYALTGNKRP